MAGRFDSKRPALVRPISGGMVERAYMSAIREGLEQTEACDGDPMLARSGCRDPFGVIEAEDHLNFGEDEG